jgi:iron complex outermembrane receptor protein
MDSRESERMTCLGLQAAALLFACVWSEAHACETVGSTPPEIDESTGIPLITVTAQRREESIQFTPIAITAFSGDSLRSLGLERSMDLAAFTPGLQAAPIAGEGNIPDIAIRGIGLNDFRDYNESPSAVYVDEVYQGALAGLDFQLFDMDRVEVLKGPQGTLFGRNATGGLIQYITKKPTDTPEAYVRLSGGSFNDVNIQAAISDSLFDGVKGRLSVIHHQHSGTEQNLNASGKDGDALDLTAERAQLQFDFSKNTLLRLTIEHGSNQNDGGNPYRFAASVLLPDSLAGLEPTNSSRNASVVASSGVSSVNVSAGPYLNTDSTSVTARFEWLQDSTRITSISNYQAFHKRMIGDCDSTPVDYCFTHFASDTRQFSQEFHVQYGLDTVRADVGLFYLSLDTIGSQELLGPIAQDLFAAPSSYTSFEPNTKSWAGFGQIEYDLKPDLTVTGGLRSTHDKKVMYQSFLNGVVPGGVIYDQSTIGDNAKLVDTSVSFLGNLRWRTTDDLMMYGGVSRAPKSGTFNSGFGPPPTAQYVVNPEQLTNYEVGVKSSWLHHQVQLDGALFHYLDRGYQAFVFQGLNQFLFNVDATATGAELELKAAPTANWNLSFGLAYLDAVAHNVADASGDVRDRAMVLAPRWSMNGVVRYWWRAWTGKMSAQLDASNSSSVYFDNLNSPALREDGHTVTGLRLGWGSADQHWNVAGTVDNLADRRYRVYAFDLTSLLGYVQDLYDKPRTFAFSFVYQY